ncbi:PREDICTED: putative zinc finger CCCH domain-containing protein 10 [Camelina sativa]|uniref:Zinc finger CCCH domain-containing protein 10 n=1 Tax=Camelina sativa TaxID=90675 RepID=A0ABM1QWC8_CAMSA|nr:PREDICTED: putative zinc finger CCCH domain-containing protein 10 [Camelina sativa]
MKETKGQPSKSRPNEFGSRSDEINGRRHETNPKKMENEDSGFGVSEEGQIAGAEYSDAESYTRDNLKKRVSDVEMQRRSHETEWILWQMVKKTKARTADLRERESKMMLDERTHGIYEHVLSSAYPTRPGEKVCAFYQTHRLCGYGSECRFNHPPLHELSKMIGQKPDCKFFKRGACRKGSDCLFYHPKEMDVGEQGRTPSLKPNDSERRYKTKSTYWQEKRVRKQNQKKEDFGFGINEVGQFRDHQGSNKDAQGIQLQQRHKDVEMRKRSRTPVRRASESRERFGGRSPRRHELGYFKCARDFQMNCIKVQDNLQKLSMGNIKRQRGEVQENLKQPRFQDISDNYNVDAQQNRQEKKKNIENERRVARLRIEQIRPTALFDEWSRPKELMINMGFTVT